VPTANTAPKIPMYRPSSRGDTSAAITTCANAVSPPAPTPCTTRLPISTPMSPANPATSEPTTNIDSDSWTSSFLLYRSESLPHSGTVAVIASSSVVTTQV
jgi:hypothetical protein